MRSRILVVIAMLFAFALMQTSHAQFKTPKIHTPKIDVKIPTPKIEVKIPKPKIDVKIPKPKIDVTVPDLTKIDVPESVPLDQIQARLPEMPSLGDIGSRLSKPPTVKELTDRLSIDAPSGKEWTKRLPTIGASAIDPLLAVAVELFRQEQVTAAKAKIAKARKQLSDARAELEKKEQELFTDIESARSGTRKNVEQEHPLREFWDRIKLLDDPHEAYKSNEEVNAAIEILLKQIRDQALNRLQDAESERLNALEDRRQEGLAKLKSARQQALDASASRHAEQERLAMNMVGETRDAYLTLINAEFDKAKLSVQTAFAAQEAEFVSQIDSTKKAIVDEFTKVRTDADSDWSKEVDRLQSEHVDAYLEDLAEEQRILLIDDTEKSLKAFFAEQRRQLDKQQQKIDKADEDLG